MATGGSNQLKPGHEGYGWGTDGETIHPNRNQPWDWATPEQQEQQQVMRPLLVLA